jgi:hypothetical protein
MAQIFSGKSRLRCMLSGSLSTADLDSGSVPPARVLPASCGDAILATKSHAIE